MDPSTRILLGRLAAKTRSVNSQGSFFSRGLNNPILKDCEFRPLETPFFLKKGENPDDIALNIVIEGTGTVWIDDITLVAGPLN